jgi:hypothetical protein
VPVVNRVKGAPEQSDRLAHAHLPTPRSAAAAVYAGRTSQRSTTPVRPRHRPCSSAPWPCDRRAPRAPRAAPSDMALRGSGARCCRAPQRAHQPPQDAHRLQSPSARSPRACAASAPDRPRHRLGELHDRPKRALSLLRRPAPPAQARRPVAQRQFFNLLVRGQQIALPCASASSDERIGEIGLQARGPQRARASQLGNCSTSIERHVDPGAALLRPPAPTRRLALPIERDRSAISNSRSSPAAAMSFSSVAAPVTGLAAGHADFEDAPAGKQRLRLRRRAVRSPTCRHALVDEHLFALIEPLCAGRFARIASSASVASSGSSPPPGTPAAGEPPGVPGVGRHSASWVVRVPMPVPRDLPRHR